MNEVQTFKYKPKHTKGFLYNGIGFSIIGLFSLIKPMWLLPYVFIGYGFISLTLYYYWQKTHYIKLDKEGITINRLISKRIFWEDYEGIRFYVGSITVLSKRKTIDINKEFLSAEDLQTIETQLKVKLPQRKVS
jgi:hypothetical protein